MDINIRFLDPLTTLCILSPANLEEITQKPLKSWVMRFLLSMLLFTVCACQLPDCTKTKFGRKAGTYIWFSIAWFCRRINYINLMAIYARTCDYLQRFFFIVKMNLTILKKITYILLNHCSSQTDNCLN